MACRGGKWATVAPLAFAIVCLVSTFSPAAARQLPHAMPRIQKSHQSQMIIDSHTVHSHSPTHSHSRTRSHMEDDPAHLLTLPAPGVSTADLHRSVDGPRVLTASFEFFLVGCFDDVLANASYRRVLPVFFCSGRGGTTTVGTPGYPTCAPQPGFLPESLGSVGFAGVYNMTYEVCNVMCDGYAHFGLEGAGECFCGHTVRAEGESTIGAAAALHTHEHHIPIGTPFFLAGS